MSSPAHNADHVWHVWMNRRQTERQKQGEAWEHSLYEFKHLLQFLGYGAKQIEQAFTEHLPTTHRQCSRCEPEPIEQNELRCCMGIEVTTCPILLSLRATIDEQRGRKLADGRESAYANVDDQQFYRLAAQTCGWHIFSRACGVDDQRHSFHLDTSEGYLLTKGDRMFWDRIYRSMSQEAPDAR